MNVKNKVDLKLLKDGERIVGFLLFFIRVYGANLEVFKQKSIVNGSSVRDYYQGTMTLALIGDAMDPPKSDVELLVVRQTQSTVTQLVNRQF